jgi:hypothetical protein
MGTTCGANQNCASLSTTEGELVEVCVSTDPICGDPTDQPPPVRPQTDSGTPPPNDAGTVDSGSMGSCGALVPPTMTAACTSCRNGTHTCQANGCYGGWWCNTDTNRCQAPPTNCGGGPSDAGSNADASPMGQDASAGFPDASPTPPGAIGPQGGQIPQLDFAIVGDTRPASIDDTSGYPTAIITRIWQDLENETPRPAFAVTTGDYMFASPSGTQASPQLDLYFGARMNFSNIVFPTMGNHECTGATASNCTATGQSNNFDVFMQRMIQPLGQSTPYYAINVSDTNGQWTAKFVFVAANAWDTSQQTWLQTVMGQQTTYTFIVRHERSTVSAPGVGPSNQIIAQFPYTLLIVGHTHTYETVSGKQVVVGNGGAPVTGGVNYGYVVGQQRADQAIVFTAKDYSTGAAVDTFVLKPDGTVTN